MPLAVDYVHGDIAPRRVYARGHYLRFWRIGPLARLEFTSLAGVPLVPPPHTELLACGERAVEPVNGVFTLDPASWYTLAANGEHVCKIEKREEHWVEGEEVKELS